jgi:hypothetical protein
VPGGDLVGLGDKVEISGPSVVVSMLRTGTVTLVAADSPLFVGLTMSPARHTHTVRGQKYWSTAHRTPPTSKCPPWGKTRPCKRMHSISKATDPLRLPESKVNLSRGEGKLTPPLKPRGAADREGLEPGPPLKASTGALGGGTRSPHLSSVWNLVLTALIGLPDIVWKRKKR